MKTLIGEIIDEKKGAMYSVSPQATVAEAVSRMNEARIGSVLVLEGERLVGIFTERDVLTKVVGKIDPAGVPVAELMTTEIVTLSPSNTVEDAMRVVTERRIRHLPVMEGEQLKGVVSSGDLTRWTVRDQQDTIDDLVNYINDWKR